MAFSLNDHPFTAAIFGEAWANKLAKEELSLDDIQKLYDFFNDVSNQTERLTSLIENKSLDKKINKSLRKLNQVALTQRPEKLPILQYWVCELVPFISPNVMFHLIEQCLAYEASLHLRKKIGTDFLRSGISPAAILMRATMADILHPGSSSELQTIHSHQGKMTVPKLNPIIYRAPTEKTIEQIPERLISLYYKYAVLGMRQQTQSEQRTKGYAEGALKYFLTLGVMGFYVDYWIGRETTEKKKLVANAQANAVLKEIAQATHPVMQALVKRFASENQHIGKLAIVDELIKFDLPESEIVRIYQMLSSDARFIKTEELEKQIKAAYEEVGNLSLQNLDDLRDAFLQPNQHHGKQERVAEDVKTLRAILTFKILSLLDPENEMLIELNADILFYTRSRRLNTISQSDWPSADMKSESKQIDKLLLYIRHHFTLALAHGGLESSFLKAYDDDSFKRATIRGQLRKLSFDHTISVRDRLAIIRQSVHDLHSPLIEKKLHRESMIIEVSEKSDVPEICIEKLLNHSPSVKITRRGSTEHLPLTPSSQHTIASAAASPRIRAQSYEDIQSLHFDSPVPILNAAPKSRKRIIELDLNQASTSKEGLNEGESSQFGKTS